MPYTYHRDFSTGIDEKYMTVLRYLPTGVSILELGCHTGYFSALLRSRGYSVLGVDRDESALCLARQRGIDVVKADVETESLRGILTQRYDRILLMDILEHLNHPESLLKEVMPLLTSEGRLVVTGPNIAYWACRKDLFLGRCTAQDAGVFDRTHVHFYSAALWRRLLEQSGYAVTALVPSEGFLPLEHIFKRVRLLHPVIGRLRALALRYAPNVFASGFLIEARPSLCQP